MEGSLGESCSLTSKQNGNEWDAPYETVDMV